MSDKDQFTFDDDDDFPETNLGDQDDSQPSDLSDERDFPETDLSAAFYEGEHSAEELLPDEPELKVKGGGNPRTRILLMVLLLVVAGGAGAYYFMDLGGTTPSVPTVPAPARTGSKSIALPPQPTQAPAAKETVESAAKVVSVAVPPPPPPAEPAVQAAPAKPPVAVVSPTVAPMTKPEEKPVAEKLKEEPVKQPAIQVAVPVPQPKAVAPRPADEPAPAQQQAVSAARPASPAVAPTEPAKVSMQLAGGAFALDAGSYLLESNRDSLVAKIKKLGYEPLVTPVDATLDMTRLRLGTFGKDEVQKALDFARSIEPGAYSTPAGDRYVIYAGTFLKSRNVDKLSQRFLAEGIKVYPEPVQVVRTLSRIRFGSFATKEDAATAAQEAEKAGLKAAVVKSK